MVLLFIKNEKNTHHKKKFQQIRSSLLVKTLLRQYNSVNNSTAGWSNRLNLSLCRSTNKPADSMTSQLTNKHDVITPTINSQLAGVAITVNS